ncbi:MAG: DsbA family protein [Pseudobdellovibrionaceae bacterium]
MKYIGKLFLAVLGSGMLLVPGLAQAENVASAPVQGFTAAQRGELEDFVRNFILDNPEVLMESVERYREKEGKKAEDQATKSLEEAKPYIYSGKHPEAGNPKGDVTVVEFYDFNCGFCKRAFDVLNQAIEKDKNLRVILLDLPILSPASEVAAKWALAAHKQGKYWEFHKAVITSSAPKDEENLGKIAATLGLDATKLKADAASEEIATQLKEIRDLAQKLGVSGTPGFVVGGQIIRGYVDLPVFVNMVAEARKSGKK